MSERVKKALYDYYFGNMPFLPNFAKYENLTDEQFNDMANSYAGRMIVLKITWAEVWENTKKGLHLK